MAEWIYEAGIGENRAALIEDGAIVEIAIESEFVGLRAGAIVAARLRADRIIDCEGGEQALIDSVPRGMSEGAALFALIMREALPEPGKPKRAKARHVPGASAPRPAPALIERIGAAIELLPHAPDALEAAGWSEMIEQAASGHIAFAGGALQISLTPAMTLIDVDGNLEPVALGIAGAAAAARAIRAFDIAGSIGVDFPTTNSKAERAAIADAFDAILPPPFERTAVNGFGFMQIIRPRQRASLCERLAADPVGHAARALIRRAERSGVIGNAVIVAPPHVEAHLGAHPEWLMALGRRLGGTISLRVDPRLAISGGYVDG
ncbi:MAG: ribonuclease [Sphingomonadaceae bacterium]